MIKKIIFGGFITIIICFIFTYFILPYFLHVAIKKIPKSSIIYDENNIELGEIVKDSKYRYIQKDISFFPDFLKKALVSIEDRRFYSHSGIDFKGILRSLKNNITGGNTQGASTIENQIIRNNYWLNEKRSIKLKIKEFLFSLTLDKKYSKDEILNIYLNHIYFGYLNYGFEAASRFYYGKSLNNITKSEIIGLITIMKNPNKYSPYNQLVNFNKRYKILVLSLYKNKIISLEEKEELLTEKFIFKNFKRNKLPYITDFLGKNYTKDENLIKTTINYNLTENIDNIARFSIEKLYWKNVSDYGIIIIDRKNMDLKVMIGGIDYYNKDGQVNSTLAKRQPGSSLKPFLYLKSFSDLGKTPTSRILDLPVKYKTKDGYSYEPKNYSLKYLGDISYAEALSQSINIPAVKILNELGIDNFLKFLKKLGITSLNKNGDFYGLSLALGTGEISLYELTQAYSVFAEKGFFCSINVIKGEKTKCNKITDEKYTNMIEYILTNRYFKLAGFPINSSLDFEDRNIFFKTGTSRNFRDNWTIGYTDKYLIGVWVGNKDGSNMKGVSGASGAGEIFRKIVYFLDNEEVVPLVPHIKNEKNNYFKIISPVNKTVYKIDDFTPIDIQEIKLKISTNLKYDKLDWYIDNKEYKKDFLSLKNIKNKATIKAYAIKDGEIIGSDEVSISIK